MKTFKQLLSEMPALVHTIQSKEAREKSGRSTLNDPIKMSDFALLKNKKVSKFDKEHDIYYSQSHDILNNSGAFLVVHRPSGRRIKAVLTGKKFLGEFNIHWAEKHSSAKFNMTDVYHHIIHNHMPLVSSSEHSPGSYENWKKLAMRPDIHITSLVNGESGSAFGPDEWDKNYQGGAVRERVHRLRASKK